jgi:L-asparaginase
MAGIGVVITMNDEIHAARWARKQDSFRTSAFLSPGRGPIGVVTPGQAEIHIVPPLVGDAFSAPANLDRHVPIVQAYTGMPAELIDAVVEVTGACGLVVEGTGLGNVPGTAVSGIERALARSLPVVVATQVPTGGTRAVYGGPGGGVTLRDLGVVGAKALSAAKARLLLSVLLASGLRGIDAAAGFESYASRMG